MDSSWFTRLLGRLSPSPNRNDASIGGQEPTTNVDTQGAEADPTPVWAERLSAEVKRLGRAQGKLALQLEVWEESLGRRLDAVPALIAQKIPQQNTHAAAAHAPPEDDGTRWDALFDALDLLDEACNALERRNETALAEGLRGVCMRLERLAADSGHERLTAIGTPLDGERFRAVGTDDQQDIEDGVVTQVVRAAVLRGGQLVREGEVIINRKETP